MSNRYPIPSMASNNIEVSQQLLNVFQMQKQQLNKMKEQNKILTSLNQKVLRKDQEIEELQKLVKRYKKYYDQFQYIKATLNQKTKQLERVTQENKILFSQMNKIISDNKQLQDKLLQIERLKHDFVKERNATDARHREIQQTFRQYQDQCKNKMREIARDLQRANQLNKQLSSKIENLNSVRFQNEQLKAKITNFNTFALQNTENETGQILNQYQQQNMSQNRTQNISGFINPQPMTFHSQALGNNKKSFINFSKSRQKSPNKSNSRVYDQETNAEIQRLRRQLINKQIQLQRSKALNHQLSIQFDKSVSKICEFEKELSMYRKQNHQLKKTLSLFVEKQQYEKMHRNKIKNSDSQDSNNQQDQQQSQDIPGYSQISDSRR